MFLKCFVFFKSFLAKKFNTRKRYVKTHNNRNSQATTSQQLPKDEEEEEDRTSQRAQINELDRLENVLAQHHEEEGEQQPAIDFNNNNLEYQQQTDNNGDQYETREFIVNGQQQHQAFDKLEDHEDLVIPNENDDLLKQLAEITAGQPQVEQAEEEEEEEDEEEENKENISQKIHYRPLIKKNSRSTNNIGNIITSLNSDIAKVARKRRASLDNNIDDAQKRLCSAD